MSEKHTRHNKKERLFTGILGTVFIALSAVVCMFMIKDRTETKSIPNDDPFRTPQSVSASDNKPADDNKSDEIVKISEATISVTGDLLFHDAVLKAGYDSSAKKYNFDNIFTYFSKYVSASDYSIANLETTLRGTEGGTKYQGYPNFNTPDVIVDSSKKAGFDMLLTANNHSYDTGTKGMKRTVEVIGQKGMDYIGTMSDSNAKKYLVKEVNGIKLGMMCYTYETTSKKKDIKYLNGIAMDKDACSLINSFNYSALDDFYSELESNITAMKSEGAEAVVLFIHWGTEYKIKQNAVQTKMAQSICNLGVDVIVGGHPHVIQPIELLTSETNSAHKTLCLYSMGNAVSNQRSDTFKIDTGHTEDGVLFSVTFSKYSNGKVVISDTNILPIWVNLFTDKNTKKRVYQIIPLDKSVSDWKSAFNLSTASLRNANKSYDRTMDIVGDGLKKSQEHFRNSAADIVSSSDITA